MKIVPIQLVLKLHWFRMLHFAITNKNHSEGEKQAGRGTAVQADITHTRQKTKDQHRTTDTSRINRETNQEGNEGDTGGATETIMR